MNRIYRVIWSKAKEKWVVVAEKVAARGCCPATTVGALTLAALLASGGSVSALDPGALPTGGRIVAGQGAISQSGSALTVNQNSGRMIANWSTFNIGQNASVRFSQPGASSVALNRIQNQNPSQIQGKLSANGQVWLINPSGILFGSSARVDVGGLIASSLNISNENFLAGKNIFEKTGSAGSITNQGDIRTTDGGYVAFLAPKVTNEGTVTTPKGTVALAAGDKVSLDFTGDSLVTFTVDQGAVDALAENRGLIKADGGIVMLTAKGADALTNAVVNNSGIIEAHTLENRAGRILLISDMEHGETTVGGRLDASAPNGGDGGFIETSAAKVTVKDDARVYTTSTNGKSGLWLIDPQDFTIGAGGDISGATIATNLQGGNITILNSSGGNPGSGDILINDNINTSADLVADRTLTLKAERDIVFAAGKSIDATLGGNTKKLNVSLISDSDTTNGGAIIFQNGGGIKSNGGTITLAGGDGTGYATGGVNNYTIGGQAHQDGISINAATLNSGGGAITMRGKGYAGNLSLHGGGLWAKDATITTGGGSLSMTLIAQETGGATEGGVRYGGYFDNLTIATGGGQLDITTPVPAGTAWTGLTTSGTINSGAGNISITTDRISISNSVAGTGTLTIKPDTAGSTIGIAGGAGTLALTAANVATDINNGFSAITIGSATAGDIQVGATALTYNDPLTLKTGSDILFNGASLTGGGNALTLTSDAEGNGSGGITIYNSTINSAGGNITLGGGNVGGYTGGLTSGNLNTQATTSYRIGISVGKSTISAGGGNISMMGQGAGGGAFTRAKGVELISTLGGVNVSTTGSGTITIDGKGAADSGGINYGVNFNNSSGLAPINLSSATGNITVSGVGGGSGNTNHGVYLEGSASSNTISTTSGIITITGTKGNGTSTGFIEGSNTTIGGNSTTGNVNLVSDTMTISGSVKSTGTLTVKPLTDTTTIGIAGGAGTLQLTSANFATSFANGFSGITIGSATSGAITVGGATTMNDSTTLLNNSTIAINGAITANENLTMTSNGAITIGAAINAPATGLIDIASRTGDLTVSQNISTGNSTASAIKLNAGKDAAAGTATGGNIIISGTPTITTGAGGFATLYSGSITGSTGLATLVGSGSGRFRYNSDETASNFTTGLTAGKNAIYRQQPTVTTTASPAGKTYNGLAFIGGAGVNYSGFVNGDTSAILGGTLSYGGTSQGARSAGIYTITPSGYSNGLGYSLGYTSGNLVISKAHLTVTASNQSRVYGAANPTFSETVSGFVNGENATTAVITGSAVASSTATATTGVGTATITASAGTLTAANYDFTNLVNGTLTINKAHLTVTANNQSRTYGAANPTFSETISGFVNGETVATAGITGSATGSSPAIATTGVGTSTITASAANLNAANYDFPTLVNGTLTINKAHLTVTADNQSRIYGAANPTFSETIIGFVNGENAATAGISGSAFGNSTATATTGVGTATIAASAGALSAANYDFTNLVNGTLTINKAHLTVSADNQSKTNGAANPTFSETISGFVNSENSTSAGITGSATGNSTATATTGVGTATITASAGTLSAGNYDFTNLVNGTLTIKPAPASIDSGTILKTSTPGVGSSSSFGGIPGNDTFWNPSGTGNPGLNGSLGGLGNDTGTGNPGLNGSFGGLPANDTFWNLPGTGNPPLFESLGGMPGGDPFSSIPKIGTLVYTETATVRPGTGGVTGASRAASNIANNNTSILTATATVTPDTSGPGAARVAANFSGGVIGTDTFRVPPSGESDNFFTVPIQGGTVTVPKGAIVDPITGNISYSFTGVIDTSIPAVNSQLTLDGTGSGTIKIGTVGNNATLFNNSSANISIGTLNGSLKFGGTGTGTTTIGFVPNGGVITNNGTGPISIGTATGAITLAGTGTGGTIMSLLNGGNLTINSNGNFDIRSILNGTITNNSTSGTLTVSSGSGTINFEGNINFGGTGTGTGGTILSVLNGGNLTINSNGNFDIRSILNGTITNNSTSGTLTVSSGSGTINFGGTSVIGGTILSLIDGGNLTNNGTGPFAIGTATGNISFSGTGTGPVTIGSFLPSSGTATITNNGIAPVSIIEAPVGLQIMGSGKGNVTVGTTLNQKLNDISQKIGSPNTTPTTGASLVDKLGGTGGSGNFSVVPIQGGTVTVPKGAIVDPVTGNISYSFTGVIDTSIPAVNSQLTLDGTGSGTIKIGTVGSNATLINNSNANISISTLNGNITIGGTGNNDATVNLGTGNVTFGKTPTAGTVTINSVANGGVITNNGTGPISIGTATGAITLAGTGTGGTIMSLLNGGNVTVNSNGNLDISSMLNGTITNNSTSGTLVISSGSGNIGLAGTGTGGTIIHSVANGGVITNNGTGPFSIGTATGNISFAGTGTGNINIGTCSGGTLTNNLSNLNMNIGIVSGNLSVLGIGDGFISAGLPNHGVIATSSSPKIKVITSFIGIME